MKRQRGFLVERTGSYDAADLTGDLIEEFHQLRLILPVGIYRDESYRVQTDPDNGVLSSNRNVKERIAQIRGAVVEGKVGELDPRGPKRRNQSREKRIRQRHPAFQPRRSEALPVFEKRFQYLGLLGNLVHNLKSVYSQ
jgi:hypothetical protein